MLLEAVIEGNSVLLEGAAGRGAWAGSDTAASADS